VTPGERWPTSLWPFVRDQLPPPPASVLELGCGSLGGFVPALVEGGYAAIGIDRHAPDAASYRQVDFEQYEPPEPVHAIVASRSLHHVADLADVLDRVTAALRPGGAIIVVEWARERCDEHTAQWCFARADTPAASEPGWLQRRRDEWAASGQSWEEYFEGWARREHLHTGDRIVHELDRRFDRKLCDYGAYFFADLAGIAEADEQAAIDAGEIRATRIRYVGARRA
jgi:SAM-dependent methyltransferase